MSGSIMRESSEFTHAGNSCSLFSSSFHLAGNPPSHQVPKSIFLPAFCLRVPKVEAFPLLWQLSSQGLWALTFELCFWCHPAHSSPSRYCTEGKRTFSSRLILEKHVQVRHGLPLGTQSSPGRGNTLTRGSGARAQVGMALLWNERLQTLASRSQRGEGTRESGVDKAVSSTVLQGPGRKRRQSSDSCSEEPDSTTPPAKSPRGGPGSGGHGPLRYRSSGSVEQSIMVGLRVDGGAQQCLDCGLCFASPGSLSRHRFISHKKRRGVGRASVLGLGDGEEEAAPPSRSDPEGGDSPLPASGGPLTCKVCGKSCDSPLNLKTHFRTHGMAFIRARQGGSGDN
jgi:hypothetical protein